MHVPMLAHKRRKMVQELQCSMACVGQGCLGALKIMGGAGHDVSLL